MRDWQLGDLRGVLEILRPLDQDTERVQYGLRGTFILVAVIAAALRAISGLVLSFPIADGPSRHRPHSPNAELLTHGHYGFVRRHRPIWPIGGNLRKIERF
jgi:hypothetical protein